MRALLLRPRSASAYRLMWWLCLALLMPAAQSAAAWHAVSHTVSHPQAAGTEPSALHPGSHCDLCLAAAALSGGALTGEPQVVLPATARHAAPQARLDSVWLAPAARPYHSRAPPFTLS